MKKCEKALRHARQKGFDEGFKLAKAVFAEIMANLIEEHRRDRRAEHSDNHGRRR